MTTACATGRPRKLSVCEEGQSELNVPVYSSGGATILGRTVDARSIGGDFTCGLLHLCEGESTGLGRGVFLALCLDPCIATWAGDDLVWNMFCNVLCLLVIELATDETLGGVESVGWVGDGNTLGWETDLSRG